ncbi:hypothetical protein ACLKA6_013433 [Drosophila palustris]
MPLPPCAKVLPGCQVARLPAEIPRLLPSPLSSVCYHDEAVICCILVGIHVDDNDVEHDCGAPLWGIHRRTPIVPLMLENHVTCWRILRRCQPTCVLAGWMPPRSSLHVPFDAI